MKPEEIKFGDWMRVFVGEVPASFYLEIIIRMAVVYALLIVSMRLLGKRMASQLTRNELAAMVSLAAAIGVPILAPDRGILPAIIIAIVVIAVTRASVMWSTRSEKVESVMQGAIDVLVAEGILDLKRMLKTRITRERIFAQLRSEGILHLGQVKRFYIEANGGFTLVQQKQAPPGLAVIPGNDVESFHELNPNHLWVCDFCGQPGGESQPYEKECPNCHKNMWTEAVEVYEEAIIEQ